MQWKGAADDGIGIQFYDVYRDGNLIGIVYPAAVEDCTVTPDQGYTYQPHGCSFSILVPLRALPAQTSISLVPVTKLYSKPISRKSRAASF
jgi:hypothetical protein